ncbi:hypothetical protein BJ138DRAFT_1163965 [Hygrophoropsis aurantiaca]|uniref:Uncharacterized protein n=1 Tax=Hygrophoropsis aurantiaca TaxID=72124 RepID=A0ACB7ZX92_9AGAM|nr:hypothetical protein BJ138DRAFT_1163965 [Hygrophoropsis aurantiaca]
MTLVSIRICGETNLKLVSEEGGRRSRFYEYYIPHHLPKVFESLFGSVSGSRSLSRTASSTNNADTLRKKNMFSPGEDRFLTTFLLKHFPDVQNEVHS